MYTIRPYRPPDCPEMAQLFYNTVHIINARDYTPRQLDAWATGTVDLAAWDRSFRAHRHSGGRRGGHSGGVWRHG